MIQCHQCQARATHFYTWPGKEQEALCLRHMREVLGTTPASVLSVKTIPLSPDERAVAAAERDELTAQRNAAADAKGKRSTVTLPEREIGGSLVTPE